MFDIYFKNSLDVDRSLYCTRCHSESESPDEQAVSCPACGSTEIIRRWINSPRFGDIYNVVKTNVHRTAGIDGDIFHVSPEVFWEIVRRIGIEEEEFTAELSRHGYNRYSMYSIDVGRAKSFPDALCILKKEKDNG